MRKDFEEALKRGMREFGQIIKKTSWRIQDGP